MPAVKQPTVVSTSGTAPSQWSPSLWAKFVLAFSGLPATQNNVNNLLRWVHAESGATWDHDNNPLNTSTGTHTTNGTGGQRNLLTSAWNTAVTLRMPNYTAVAAALEQTATAHTFSHAVVASPWAASHYGGTPTAIADNAILSPGAAPQATRQNPGIMVSQYLASAPGAHLASFTFDWLNPLDWGTKIRHAFGNTPSAPTKTAIARGASTPTRIFTPSGTNTSTNPKLSTLTPGNPLAAFSTIANDITRLTNLTLWKRVGIFVAGLGMAVVGLVLLAAGNKDVQSAAETAALA